MNLYFFFWNKTKNISPDVDELCSSTVVGVVAAADGDGKLLQQLVLGGLQHALMKAIHQPYRVQVFPLGEIEELANNLTQFCKIFSQTI